MTLPELLALAENGIECPPCRGTGRKHVPSFANLANQTEISCPTCHGKGRLRPPYEDSVVAALVRVAMAADMYQPSVTLRDAIRALDAALASPQGSEPK